MALWVSEVAKGYLAKIRSDELAGGIEQFNCLLFVLQLPSICSRLEFPLYKEGELVIENADLYNVSKMVVEEARQRKEEANTAGGAQKEIKEPADKDKVKGRGKGTINAKKNKGNSVCKEIRPKDKEMYTRWLEKHNYIASHIGQVAFNPQAFYLALYELRCSLTHAGVSHVVSGRVNIVRFIEGYNQSCSVGAELFIPFKLFCELMLSTALGSLAKCNKQISPFESILVSADFLSTRFNSDYCKALPKFYSELSAEKKSLYDFYNVLTNYLGFRVCPIDNQGNIGIHILALKSKFEEEDIYTSSPLITQLVTGGLGSDSLRAIRNLCRVEGFEFIEGLSSNPEAGNDCIILFPEDEKEKFPVWCHFNLDKSLYEEMISVMEEYVKFLAELKEKFYEDFRA